jgi:hypothetical protein
MTSHQLADGYSTKEQAKKAFRRRCALWASLRIKPGFRHMKRIEPDLPGTSHGLIAAHAADDTASAS